MAALALLAGPLRHASAQAPDGWWELRRPQAPRWQLAWSALDVGREMDRTVVAAPELPNVLAAPVPRAGAFWTGGNPGALAFEVHDVRGELELVGGGESGDYHRPLDEDGLGLFQLRGLHWRPLGKGAVIGSVVGDRATSDAGSAASGLRRHAADPFVLSDTTSPPMTHVRVRVEGAYGWLRGAWGAGLGLGLEVTDDRSNDARLARLGRSAAPSVSAGVLRSFGPGLRVGTRFRWTGQRDNLRLAAAGTVVGVVRGLQGYGEPESVEFVNGIRTRIVERDALAIGADAAGTAGAWTWALRSERLAVAHSHRRQVFSDLPPDQWDGSGWAFGAAAVGRAPGERLLLSADASYRTLQGDAFVMDLEGAIVRRRDRRLHGRAEARYRVPEDRWMLAAALEGRREEREHHDFLAQASSDISSTSPGVAVELVRRVGTRTHVSLGGSVAAHTATSTLPNADALGPVYRSLMAPELALYASRATAWSVAGTLRHSYPGGFELLIRGAGGAASPSGESDAPLAPAGRRTHWTVTVGGRWSG